MSTSFRQIVKELDRLDHQVIQIWS